MTVTVKRKIVTLLGILLFGAAAYFLAPASLGEAGRRVLFIFIIGASFWAAEIIPLFATSLLVVVLEIFLLCRPGILPVTVKYQTFLAPFGDSVIILFLGGFVLAAALHKYGVDQLIARRILGLFGNRPLHLLLGIMATTALLSMWMSDTATTAMMIAMMAPVLQGIPAEDPFRKALILGIPFAALIGGMCTPVGTPPNAIAVGLLANQGHHILFLDWMKMAVPLGFILIFVAAAVLYLFFSPQQKAMTLAFPPPPALSGKGQLVIAIGCLTIGLWLTAQLTHIPVAVTALTATCLFTLTGLLTKEDIKRMISWDILILMWGGLSLGKGVELSGFADWIVGLPVFANKGFILAALFCLLAVALSAFMSNTATANLLIPIIIAMPGENPVLLAAAVALSCSLAMILPVSTPPNAIAFSLDMIESKDMVKSGLVIALVSLGIILLGFRFVIPRALGL